MNAIKLLQKYYPINGKTYPILLTHSLCVSKKALELARLHPEMPINITFIKEAALLHDIGIFLCDAPDIECNGTYPYIAHGYLGADILRKEGYPIHALVCERHTGIGLSISDIQNNHLPIPIREMKPISIEEQLICFADKFYSKTQPNKEKSVEQIRESLSKFGIEALNQIDEWIDLFITKKEHK